MTALTWEKGDSETLNVEIVPGLYYAADSAAIMSVAERRTPVRGAGGRCGCRAEADGRAGLLQAGRPVVGPYRVEG